MYESLVAEYLEYQLPDYIPRHTVISELPAPKRRNLIYSIVGVRRCGKTFYLFQLMDNLRKQGVSPRKMFYFPFDDDRIDLEDPKAASVLLDAYYKLVPEAEEGCYLFFDEIQEVTDWDSFIRRVAEQNNTTVVITGSSSKLLSTDIPTKLRGRSLTAEMWPLSFSEYCEFIGVDTGATEGAYSQKASGKLEAAFARYLETGGFPAGIELNDTDRVRLLQAYSDEIVTKDVLERFESASYRVGRRYARNALRSTGLKFSVNKQVASLRSAGLSISNEAAYSLLDDFEDAHLMFKVVDYHLSIKDNPKTTYKLYAVDPGLSLAVAPANHLDLGQRLETAVFVELMRRYGLNRDRVISSYSSSACPEVDFVVGDVLLEAEYELIQVTAEDGFVAALDSVELSDKQKTEIKNLSIAMGETGLKESWLITLSEEAEVKVETGTVRIIPVWKWALLTPQS